MSETINQTISKQDLIRITRERQIFRLNRLSTAINFQKNITYWEQLTCAGYNPQFRRLEAVVDVKQTSGYNGSLCSNASTEYVRFFVDFHDGNGFQNMGYTSFKVADISNNPPGPQHPLSYLAYLFIDDSRHRKFLDCDHAVIPRMRAVLSWNSIPSLDPDEMPHYGNRVDADIQLARKLRLFPVELAEVFKAPDLVKYLDPTTEIKLLPQVKLSAENILRVNKTAGVPEKRTLYSVIGKRFNSNLDFSRASGNFEILPAQLDSLKLDFTKFIDVYNGLDGKKADTTYEELTCIGLNPQTDSLGAVIHIKKSAGFNGDMCTKGSMEHVAFWADWNNNGTFDQYLGTVSVNVHDIQNVPKRGLYYNVLLPIDVADRLKSCNSPNVIRVRAVLSWESLPSTTNPNQLNAWGNYKDALVQLRPKLGQGSGIHSAIHTVGGVDRQMIDPVQYLYNYQAAPTSINNNRPWGGGVAFGGIIDRNGFGGVVKYRFLYKKLSEPVSAFKPASIAETFLLDDLNTPAPAFADPQTNPDGWFEYKQNPAIGLYSVDNRLATWQTGGLDDGPYTIRFVHTDEFGVENVADQFTIMICNKGMTISPTANASVDTNFDLDLVIDGGDCHSYPLPTQPKPEIINGHLRAVHPYFASWALSIQPTAHTNGAAPSPPSRSYSSLGDTGDANGTWSLDTTLLEPCGYAISIGAHTRVIMNSSGNFPYYAPKAVGFSKK